MAFNISYVYQAIDKFTPVSNKIRRNVDGLSARVNKSATSMKKFSASMASAGQSMRSFGTRMTAFATVPIGLLGYNMLQAASDAEETASKFDVVFSSISSRANQSAMELAKSYGLSRDGAKKLLGDTGDLLTGFGFTQEAAFDLSEDVQKLAVDLASFTNFSGGAEGASAAITKALLGERESIKSLGIAILEEDVKARVALLTKKGMTFATERQAKAFATLQLATEQSKNAIGDYARTSGSFANKQRELRNRISDLNVTLGKMFIPLALKATKIIMGLAERFELFARQNPLLTKIILSFAGIIALMAPLILLLGIAASGFALLVSPVALLIGKFILIASAISFLLIKFPKLSKALLVIAGTVGVLKIAYIALNAALLATPIGAAIAGLAALGAAYVTFKDQIDEAMFSLGEWIAGVAKVKYASGFTVSPDIKDFERTKAMLEAGSKTSGISQMEPLRGIPWAAQDTFNKSVIDINVNDPGKTIKDVRATTTGSKNANLGVNMAGGAL